MKKLYLALIGLARAADNNEHMLTGNTFSVVRDALIAKEPADVLFTRIADEKRSLVPMCFDCPSPCGRTADPDDSFWDDTALRRIDFQFLESLLRCGLAYYGEDELDLLLNKAQTIYQ